jgi:hypothetical protein
MKLRVRRRSSSPTPPTPLSEAEVLLLLLGREKSDPRRGSVIKQLQFTSLVLHDPEICRRHEPFLVAEAKRLGIARPADGFYAEAIFAQREAQAAKWERRQRLGDRADDGPVA